MKRKASVLLFGASFLIAILGEAYLLNEPQPHLLSIIGIGIVVILTGYLFLDAALEYIASSNKKNDLLSDEGQRLEAEKWDSRFTELLNIQKATYAALKKSDNKVQEDIKALYDMLKQIIQLQNMTIDGQKKALNISVNYSRENMNKLLDAIINEGNDDKEKAASEISPLYDDPNATLTADEITKLFDSYGE